MRWRLGTFAEGCRERSGGLVGGQVGYRWQASQWVFGVEAQGDWADLSSPRVSLFDPLLSTSHQNRWHRPLYRPGRLRLECSAALHKGRRGGDSNRFSILDNLNSALNWPRQARPAGAAPWVSDLSTALHRTGRSVLNTTTCSWAMPIIRSRSSIRYRRLCSTTGSARTWIWSPCASTTASAVTGRQSRLATDQRLVSSKQSLKPRHRAGAFLLVRMSGAAAAWRGP